MTPVLWAAREEKSTQIPPKSPPRLASREVERWVPVNPNLQGEDEKNQTILPKFRYRSAGQKLPNFSQSSSES